MAEEKTDLHSADSTLGLLLILFIALKLTGQISWSWLWVLAPLWMPIALVIGGLVIWATFFDRK